MLIPCSIGSERNAALASCNRSELLGYVEWSAIGESVASAALLVFRATTVHLPLNEKAGPASTYVHRGPALIYFAEPHQTAAILARDGKAALAP
jgi:hypothetical protein